MRKKIITFTLLILMLLQFVETTQASIDDLPEGYYTDFTKEDTENDESTRADTIKYKQIYELLRYLNIISDDTLRDDADATKGLAAHVFAGIVTRNKLQYRQCGIADVFPNTLYADGIYTALQFNVIDPVTRFLPNQAVRLEEAADMAIRALGYVEMAATDSPLTLAYTLRLFNGIDTSRGVLSNGELMLLASNTLETQPVRQQTFGSGSNKITKEDETILSDLGIILQRGIVTAVGDYSLFPSNKRLDKQTIQINRKDYPIFNEFNPEYFGKAIYAYIDTFDGNNMVITAWENATLNNTVEFEKSDIQSVSPTQIEAITQANRLSRNNIGSNAMVLYNFNTGIAVDQAVADGLFDRFSFVTLIDNNGDNQVDIIMLKKYDYYLVESVSRVSNIIAFKRNMGRIDGSDSNVTVSIFVEGLDATIDDVFPNDAVSVMHSNRQGQNIYHMNVSRNTVTGVLDEIVLDDRLFFKVNDNIYQGTDEFLSYFTGEIVSSELKPSVGETVKLFLSTDGKIIDSSLESKFTFAYLMGISLGKGLEKECQIKVYTISGKVETHTIKNNIILYTPRPSNNDFFTIRPKVSPEDVYSELISDGEFTTDMIAYIIGADGGISTLAVEYNHLSKAQLITTYPLVKSYITGYPGLSNTQSASWLYMRILGNWFNVPSNTPSIQVAPQNSEASIRADNKLYQRWNYGTDEQLSSNYETGDSLTLYNADSAFNAGFIVYKPAEGASAGVSAKAYANIIMISKKTRALNEEGIEVERLHYRFNESMMHLDMTDEAEFSFETASSAGYYGRPASLKELAAGDIIQYETNAYGEISVVRVLFRNADRGQYRNQGGTQTVTEPSPQKTFSELGIAFGKVVDKKGGALILNLSHDGTDKDYEVPYFITNTRRGVHGNNTYTMFDSDTFEVHNVGMDEIQIGDEVVLRSDYNIVINVFIYR